MDDRITCNISLNEGIDKGSYRQYEPGSPISGRVQIIPDEDINSRKGAVRLQWFTQGRGDRNGATFQEKEMWQGQLYKGRPVETEFHFQLPMEPWSYSGHYINIVWQIFVYIDVPMAGDPKYGKDFVMRPEGAT